MNCVKIFGFGHRCCNSRKRFSRSMGIVFLLSHLIIRIPVSSKTFTNDGDDMMMRVIFCAMTWAKINQCETLLVMQIKIYLPFEHQPKQESQLFLQLKISVSGIVHTYSHPQCIFIYCHMLMQISIFHSCCQGNFRPISLLF